MASAQDSENWNDMRVGLFIHWGLYSASEGAWQGSRVGGASEWIQQGANIPTSSYASVLKPQFTPSADWATNIAREAKAAGMEYVVITAKHHDGFTLFNSTEYWSTGASDDSTKTSNPYGGSNISPPDRDLMLELCNAVRAEGLKVGLYYSIIDWQHPNAYRGNNGLPKPSVMANSKYDENSADPDPAAGSYKTYIYNHVEQLMTQYGEICELWFDYSSHAVQDSDWGADALMAMIRSHQPNLMVNNRLYEGLENGNGDFATPERTIPANGLPYDWETVTSWDDTSWGYKSISNGARYKSTRQALQLYAEASSKGGNMLLNIGPDRFGATPTEQADRMSELGDWMTVNGEALKSTRASGIDASSLWGRMTMHKSGNRYYAIVFDRPADGVIDITSATEGKIVHSISVSRLTSSGPVNVPVNISDGYYSVNLDSANLDIHQSATFRIDLDAAPLPTLPNLATGKATSSSSVYDPNGLNLHGGLAVDGDYSANTSSSSLNLFHSASDDTNPWLQIELGGTYRIREITLFNRAGFTSRLRDITIEVLDSSDQVVASYAELNDGNALNGPTKLKVFLQNEQVVSGQKIRISRASDSGGGDDNTVLTLSEVEIKGSVLADATLDGSVDQDDIDLLAANWGSGSTWETGDMNGDGSVDQADLTLALTSWTGSEKANLAQIPAAFLDADADQLDDHWELIHFGSISTQDSSGNPDGDRYNNLWEMAFGGDPNVSESLLGQSTLTNPRNNTIELRYQRPKNHTSLGIIYQIEFSTSLENDSWSKVSGASVGTPPTAPIDARKDWAIMNVPTSGSRTFFRIRLISPTP
ncbi:alpha-L-fucosidase [Oceaniferula marina]|nr:alpha-L-fucosidase [Oceaniferula marina]